MSYDIARISETTTPINMKFQDNENVSGGGVISIVTSQQIQDGGRPPFWRSLNHHISVKNCAILIKILYTTADIELHDRHVIKKMKFLKFKMAAAVILKIAFLAITHRLILRFQRNFVWGSRTACSQGLNDKICKFLKSKMADGRHFENR